MKIVTNGRHMARLNAALEAVQNGCTARILTCEKIDWILNKAASKMNIPCAHMKGTRITYNGAEHFPSAYRFRPESTQFEAEHNGRHWVITSIKRGPCPNRLDNTVIRLSSLASQAILDSFDNVRL